MPWHFVFKWGTRGFCVLGHDAARDGHPLINQDSSTPKKCISNYYVCPDSRSFFKTQLRWSSQQLAPKARCSKASVATISCCWIRIWTNLRVKPLIPCARPSGKKWCLTTNDGWERWDRPEDCTALNLGLRYRIIGRLSEANLLWKTMENPALRVPFFPSFFPHLFWAALTFQLFQLLFLPDSPAAQHNLGNHQLRGRPCTQRSLIAKCASWRRHTFSPSCHCTKSEAGWQDIYARPIRCYMWRASFEARSSQYLTKLLSWRWQESGWINRNIQKLIATGGGLLKLAPGQSYLARDRTSMHRHKSLIVTPVENGWKWQWLNRFVGQHGTKKHGATWKSRGWCIGWGYSLLPCWTIRAALQWVNLPRSGSTRYAHTHIIRIIYNYTVHTHIYNYIYILYTHAYVSFKSFADVHVPHFGHLIATEVPPAWRGWNCGCRQGHHRDRRPKGAGGLRGPLGKPMALTVDRGRCMVKPGETRWNPVKPGETRWNPVKPGETLKYAEDVLQMVGFPWFSDGFLSIWELTGGYCNYRSIERRERVSCDRDLQIVVSRGM